MWTSQVEKEGLDYRAVNQLSINHSGLDLDPPGKKQTDGSVS